MEENVVFDLDRFLLEDAIPAELREGLSLQGEASADHLKAWLIYQTLPPGQRLPIEAGYLSQSFFRHLWDGLGGFELRPHPLRGSGDPQKYLQGDWICSIPTILSTGLLHTVAASPELRGCFRDGRIGGIASYAPVLLQDMASPEPKLHEFWGDPALHEFIRSACTLGNLIVVPDGFNAARIPSTRDYWDLALEKYYTAGEQLSYRGRDVATPFRQLIDAGLQAKDALALKPWIGKDGTLKEPLLKTETTETGETTETCETPETGETGERWQGRITNLAEWQQVLGEMTKRTRKRGKKLRKRLEKRAKNEAKKRAKSGKKKR